MSLMLGNMAVQEVVNYINGLQIPSLDGKPLVAYKYEKPDFVKGEYVAVNHLPFVHNDAVEEGIVNINIHARNLDNRLPDILRLAELTQQIAEPFSEELYLGKAYYNYFCDSRPTPDKDNTNYVNIQIKVIFNNLNK